MTWRHCCCGVQKKKWFLSIQTMCPFCKWIQKRLSRGGGCKSALDSDDAEVESPAPFLFSFRHLLWGIRLPAIHQCLPPERATQCFGPSLDQVLSLHCTLFSSASTSLSLLPSGYWLAQGMLNEWVFCPSCCIFRASMALRYKSRGTQNTQLMQFI